MTKETKKVLLKIPQEKADVIDQAVSQCDVKRMPFIIDAAYKAAKRALKRGEK